MENYENLGTIGEGTYGIVLKARHKLTKQIVAIKKFKRSDEDEQVRKTALREIRILKQLRHENVVNLIEVFRRKGKLYLVFEYVQRTILEDLEKHPNGINSADVKKCLYQLLKSLEFCHSHDVIHRDIKPENLLISKHGVIKLCDFGFARTTSRPGAKYTEYVATRWYRSPELLVGDTDYGKPVDVWAVGCMFAEIITGMPLFPGESDLDQLFQIMKCFGQLTPRQLELFSKNPIYIGVKLPEVTKIISLESRFPNLEWQALMLLKKCLAYKPEDRGTFSELLKHPYFDGFVEHFEEELKLLAVKDREDMFQHTKRKSRTNLSSKTKKQNAKTNPGHVAPSKREAEKMYRAIKSITSNGERQLEGKEISSQLQLDTDENSVTTKPLSGNGCAVNDKRKKNGSNKLPHLRPSTPRAAKVIALPNFKTDSDEIAATGNRRKDVIYPLINSGFPDKSMAGGNDWSNYRLSENSKAYAWKKQNISNAHEHNLAGNNAFRFKSKHSTSKRNLPQFGKTATLHPPRTPQQRAQYSFANQSFEPTYRDILHCNTPTPSFGTRFEHFSSNNNVSATQCELGVFKARHKRKPHLYNKYSKRF